MEMPDPVTGTGDVIVDVAAACALPYSAEVSSGERRYLLILSVAPGAGAIGRVRAVGPDTTRLRVGDWVHCYPTVRARRRADNRHHITGVERARTRRPRPATQLPSRLLRRTNAHADRERVPARRLRPRRRWALDRAGAVARAFRWLAGRELQAHRDAGGATGNFCDAGVAVALAMGATCVVAPGRNKAMLDELASRSGPWVRPVRLTGDEAGNRIRIVAAAPGSIDCVLDILPPSVNARAVRAPAMTVREYGRVVLTGGVGMFRGRRPGAPLFVDPAQLDQRHRPVDVQTRRERPPDRARTRRPY